MSNLDDPQNYNIWLAKIKAKITDSQLKAKYKVNEVLLKLYWDIGRDIAKAKQREGWGTKIIDRLAKDIKRDYPQSKGFSIRNLKYMLSFAEAYPNFPFVQVTLAQKNNKKVKVSLAQIPWYHHITLLSKVKNLEERIFYIQETAENGWSRNILVQQIKGKLYHRNGRAITNFKKTLPAKQSDLAQSFFKDPYQFDFLQLTKKMQEADIERQLIEKIGDFLLELGRGFAYVGKQYVINVDDTEYRLDLLFYHTILHAYVVIELKTGEFKPEYISKLNFYTTAIDKQLKIEADNPTIGLLLCAEKSQVKVKYAMHGLNKPLGVASYELEQVIKENLKELVKNKK